MDLRPHFKLGCIVGIIVFLLFLLMPGLVGSAFWIIIIISFIFGIVNGANQVNNDEDNDQQL